MTIVFYDKNHNIDYTVNHVVHFLYDKHDSELLWEQYDKETHSLHPHRKIIEHCGFSVHV